MPASPRPCPDRARAPHRGVRLVATLLTALVLGSVSAPALAAAPAQAPADVRVTAPTDGTADDGPLP